MENYDIEPDILAGFIDESLEGLELLDTLLIELEQHPEDIELVNRIFRPIHSIKGSSAFFGLMKVKELAHKMEDLLDKIRQKQMKASTGVLNVLLPGCDMLRNMFDNIRAGMEEIENHEEFQKIIDPIIEILEKPYDTLAELESENPAVLMGNILFRLEEMRTLIRPESIYIIDEVEKILSLILPEVVSGVMNEKGMAIEKKLKPPDPLEKIRDILKTPIENVLDNEMSIKVRKELVKLQQLADSHEAALIISEAFTEYDAFMENIGFDALLQEMLIEKMNKFLEVNNSKTEKIKSVYTETSAKTTEKPAVQEVTGERRNGIDRRTPSSASAEKTMRVAEKTIDSFLSYVSEFIVVEEMFNYLQKRLATSSEDKSIADDFKRVIGTFGNLSRNLRKSIFSIRTVSVRSLLQKAQRLIYDIAIASNKKVNVQIEGDNILIDKSYIEMLDAPFTHIVRNAVDHGIETEEDRIKVGKPPTGNIRIKMIEAENSTELVIYDDGKGLDYEAITRKAEELGIIAKGQVLEDEAIVDLLFVSGVSTAKEVTDVSGRGVGMDVAKKNIEDAGGKIMIKSKKGQGSKFIISLPKSVSTQIMEGCLVKTGGEIYIMPMDLIGESFALKPADISTVGEEREMVLRRKELFPILRLGAELHKDNGNFFSDVSAKKENTAISVDINSNKYALCVDEIVGVQKVVVRGIEALPVKKELFDGAAMLGDGSVAMIIGADGLSRLVGGERGLTAI